MKTRLLLMAVCCSVALVGNALAQAKSGDKKASAPKSAADLAADEFFKVRNEQGAKPDQARFQQVSTVGLNYLTQYPTHGRSGEVVRELANFGNTMRDKSLAAYRPAFVSQLKFVLLDYRDKEGLSDDGKAAVAALEAAVADYEVREAPNRDNLAKLREEIDALAQMPGAGRFLTEREISYAEILTRGFNPKMGEAHLKKLLVHPDKDLAGRAREELNLVEMRQEPFAAKFTALDGKEFDFAQLRGKVVAVAFWSTTNEASTKSLDKLKQLHSDYRKRGFEVVAVSFDKETDREKVVKWVKDNRLAWPVYLDGKEANCEFAPKLNVRRVPALALFDQKGLLYADNLRADRLEPEVRKLLGLKDAPPPPPQEQSGGKRKRK